MSIYDELGIPRLINANATLTRLGGSRLAPGVAEAMAEAGSAFVDLVALQRAVGAEIARLTRNESCYIASGAAAGLSLVTAACIAGTDPTLRERLPFTEGMRNEVIVHAHTRVGYDFAVRMAGGTLVEMGSPSGTTGADLLAAITPRTAALFYFPRGLEERGELPLETAVEVCRPRGISVVVDAAAQLPPRSNLWSFTERGADAVIFSGGKGLRGPQSSGLVLGRREIVEACHAHGSPNAFLGRGMKVGKEELCGVLAAMRWYLSLDEAAESRFYEDVVQQVIAAVGELPGVHARRIWPSEAGQPVPRAEIRIDATVVGRESQAILKSLLSGAPPIDLAAGGEDCLLVNPQPLGVEEVAILIRRLREALQTRTDDK